jgi:hypothetical protein
MTCPSCGGACGPEALKKASNEILLAEINARRESAVKQRDDFYKTHFALRKFWNICIYALGATTLYPMFRMVLIVFGLTNLQTPELTFWLSLIFFPLSFLGLLGIFKEWRVMAQFRKEYPKETKLLSGI